MALMWSLMKALFDSELIGSSQQISADSVRSDRLIDPEIDCLGQQELTQLLTRSWKKYELTETFSLIALLYTDAATTSTITEGALLIILTCDAVSSSPSPDTISSSSSSQLRPTPTSDLSSDLLFVVGKDLYFPILLFGFPITFGSIFLPCMYLFVR